MSIAQNSPPLSSPKLFSFQQQSSNLSLKNPSMISTALWRSLAKQALKLKPHQSLPTAHKTLLCFCQRSNLYEISNPTEVGFSSNFVGFGDQRFGYVRNRVGFSSAKGYASVAEALSTDASCSSSTDVDEDVGDELQHILKQMTKEDKLQAMYRSQRRLARERGMGQGKYLRLRRRQIRIETEAWEKAALEYKELLMDMCKQKLAPNLPYMKTLFLGWFEPLCSAIEKEQNLCSQGRNIKPYGPYIDKLPADMMTVITMHKMMALLMSGEHGFCRVVSAACTIGEAVEQEAKIYNFLERTKKKKVAKGQETGESVAVTHENEKLNKKVTNLMKKQKLQAVRQIVRGHDDSQPWRQDIRAKVGSRLIELLIQTAFIQAPANQSGESPLDIRPAFVHTFKTYAKDAKGRNFGRRFGVITCDPIVLKGLERTARHMVIPYMPMLVPPVNWTSYDKGGHFFLPSYVMRIHGSKQQREAVKMVQREQMEPVFKALDTLGKTRWRINKRVLNVVDRIWASGGRLADLVDRDDVPLPEEPDTEDETLLKKWRWQLRCAKKENMERHSQRCDVELKLAVARKMKDEDGFYFPHNLDFRGRAYPMHPYLNHLGSDLCRGILEFGEGRPLTKSGLRWLKIHLANLYAGGVDKLSLEGRITFIENHLEDIFDSTDRPLEGRRWWLKAEDPFQCLAVCNNLTEALRSSSPETFISHIPVHQDGSCNGLQHYAALGRDKLGAAAVNLVAGEKPADVYSGIADRVLKIMQSDAQNDPAVCPEASRARVLLNQVDRKLVKQTVMTSVYGVTYIGARDQIKRRLKERGVSDDAELFGSACYAAKVTLTALGEMFEAARSIMSWLGDCARVIAAENEPVRWTTPLGLPVVQPYRKFGRHLIKTSLQVLTLQRETEKIMVKRQRTAFPPNFVHFLDGSHMMMTEVACRKASLKFAGIHDSYWTHACDVDEMNRILREKFVELYENPVLENLLESFQQSFPELEFPPLPDRSFQINC